jgi:hypothetical protein
VIAASIEQKGLFPTTDLPHSDIPFVMIFLMETTKEFCLGHAEAFDWFVFLTPGHPS